MISVVLVTFNRSKFLKLAIQDVLNQTFKNFELIICDDASKDDTEIICRAYSNQYEQITYVRQEKNLKMPENLNVGLKLAKHPYIAVLHDGDRFQKNMLERWYNAITSQNNIAFVFNRLMNFDGSGKEWGEPSHFKEGILEGKKLLKNFYFRNGRFPSPIWGEAMIRKSCLEEYGYLKEEYGFYADVDLWMGLLQNYNAYYIDETLIHCPTKDIQPHQFDDRLMKVFFLLKRMNLKQRLITYKNSKIELFKELFIFKSLSIYGYTYNLLTLIKNFDFNSYSDAGKITLINHSLLILIWLILFPLKLFVSILQFFKPIKRVFN